MYIESLDSFIQQAEELYNASPLKTRYVVKYRHCDGKLVLKVTDDVTCLQYKTNQQSDLRKVDRLNRLFFSLMSTGEPPADDTDMTAAQQQNAAAKKGRRKG